MVQGTPLDEEQWEEFKAIVDTLVLNKDKDPELADGFRWLERRAAEKGMGFYEMTYAIVGQHVAETKAREWLKSKG